jgi:pyruvate formate lyase activating enzyme
MEMSVEEILTEIKKDMAFYGKAGGVTISGGEPFLQGKNTLKLLKACKAAGISTAVETCGYADTQTILDAVPFVDWFLWDIKDTNNERHKHYTGVYNDLIFKNLYSIVEINANIKLRCILVNDVNTNNEHYESIAEIAKKINCEGVELIPYHAYGGAKASFLGEKDNGNIDWIPEESQIEYAKSVLKSNAFKVL